MTDKQEQAITCLLPNETIQKFLLDVVDQTNFPGKMSEFVSQVKDVLKQATLGG